MHINMVYSKQYFLRRYYVLMNCFVVDVTWYFLRCRYLLCSKKHFVMYYADKIGVKFAPDTGIHFIIFLHLTCKLITCHAQKQFAVTCHYIQLQRKKFNCIPSLCLFLYVTVQPHRENKSRLDMRKPFNLNNCNFPFCSKLFTPNRT